VNPFTPEQTAAAKQLKAICDTLHAEMVVIGAMAYLSWIEDRHRHTLDIDVAVAVDLDDYQRLVALLRSARWQQDLKREHRWTTPEGIRIDIIPAGPALCASNVLEWPISGMRMSLVGFGHVFKDSIPRSLGSGLNLRVIPLPVVLLLKIVSYEDDPHSRQKDVQDVAAILNRFDPDDSRRFSSEVIAAALEYDTAGAFLLGKDLATVFPQRKADGRSIRCATARYRKPNTFAAPSTGTMMIRSNASPTRSSMLLKLGFKRRNALNARRN